MKKTIFKLRNDKRVRDAVKKIVAILCSTSAIDVVLVVLGGSFLSQNVATFLGKPNPVILSDLLFLEGSVIFAIGAFLTLGMPFKPAKQTTEEGEQPSKKRIHPSVILIITGAGLIGLSITVGTFFV